jgi:hypothetical protein
MRIRVWNAYAANNSGSYTIVGALPSAEVARAVADELKAMIEAHTAWHGSVGNESDGDGSPLAAFCRKHGLTWSPGYGGFDNWPEHSDDNRPQVAIFGNQIVVHHHYTVSLPPTFGEFFYKRGGRVESEENHAHHPIVAIASFWWGRSKEQRAQAEVEIPRLLAKLTAGDGLLATLPAGSWPAAWRTGGADVDQPPLTVGVVFEDLIAGASALQAAGEAHGARMHIRLSEAPDAAHDPLAYLRPSSPPPAVPRFDVVVTNTGDHRPALTSAILKPLGLQEWDVRRRLMELPCTLARGLPGPRAEAAVAALRRAGATVELVRNDG